MLRGGERGGQLSRVGVGRDDAGRGRSLRVGGIGGIVSPLIPRRKKRVRRGRKERGGKSSRRRRFHDNDVFVVVVGCGGGGGVVMTILVVHFPNSGDRWWFIYPTCFDVNLSPRFNHSIVAVVRCRGKSGDFDTIVVSFFFIAVFVLNNWYERGR